jgi:tetratricopeptide (TPR) repeat protein
MDSTWLTALGSFITELAGKLLANVLKCSPTEARRRSFEEALNTAIERTVEQFPTLDQLSFEYFLKHAAVASELERILESNRGPDLSSFQGALEAAGADLDTLPADVGELFSHLVNCLIDEIEARPELSALLLHRKIDRAETVLERVAQETAHIRPVARQMEMIAESKDHATLAVSIIDEDCRADMVRAQDLLKDNRPAAARDVLRTLMRRGQFALAGKVTRGECHRLAAVAAMRVMDYGDASDHLDRAKLADPDNAKLLLSRAELCLRQQEFESAQSYAADSLSKHPGSAEAELVLAIVAAQRGDVGAAKAHLSRMPEPRDERWHSVAASVEARRGDFSAAIGLVEEALEKSAKHPQLLLQAGALRLTQVWQELARLGAHQALEVPPEVKLALGRARDQLGEAVDSFESHGMGDLAAEPLIHLAAAHSLLGEASEALEAAQRATTRKNADADTWAGRAQTELNAGDAEAALRSADHALALSPSHGEAALVRAATLIMLDRASEAAVALASPSLDWAREVQVEGTRLRAEALLVAGEADEALRALDAIEDTMSETPMAVATKARCLASVGRRPEGLALLKDALCAHWSNAALWYLLGNLYEDGGDMRAAFGAYTKAAKALPTPQTVHSVCRALGRLERPRAALRAMNTFESRLGHIHPRLLYLRAQLLYAVGDLQSASEAFLQYAELHRDDADALHNAVHCFLRLGARREAIKQLRRLVEASPDDWRAPGQLANLFLAEGDSEAAFTWAQQARDRAPEEPQGQLIYIWTAFASGREKEAAAAVAQFVQRFPDHPGLRAVPVSEAARMLQEAQERGRKVHEKYRRGEIPVTLAASLIGKPLPLYRLMLREEGTPFHADTGAAQERDHAVDACRSARETVLDYASLITLCQIGSPHLLTTVFDRVLVTAETRAQVQQDLEEINQRLEYLRRRGDRAARDLLATCASLEAWRGFSPEGGDWPNDPLAQDRYLCQRAGATYLVDRKMIEDTPVDHLPAVTVTSAAMLNHLWHRGQVTEPEYRTAKQYLHETGSWEPGAPVVAVGWPCTLVLECFTLLSWHEMGLLGWLVDNAQRVLVSPFTSFWLGQQVYEEDTYCEAAEITRTIDDTLSSDPQHIGILAPSPADLLADAGNVMGSDSLVLAHQSGIPLWSDDVATKAVYAQKSPEARSFSTRIVIDVARENGLLDEDGQSEAVLKLARAGYSYCWFSADTLMWTLRQHNFKENEHTDLLLHKAGNARPFAAVAAGLITRLVTTYGKPDGPEREDVVFWMRKLHTLVRELSPQVGEALVDSVNRLLPPAGRILWNSAVGTAVRIITPPPPRILRPGPPFEGVWRPDGSTET